MTKKEQKRLNNLVKHMVTHHKTKEEVVRDIKSMGFSQQAISRTYERVILDEKSLRWHHAKFYLIGGLLMFPFSCLSLWDIIYGRYVPTPFSAYDIQVISLFAAVIINPLFLIVGIHRLFSKKQKTS